MLGDRDLTVVARASLLDALQALREQSSALVVVGAQAIYLRVGEAYAAVAPFTTDGDLMVDPTLLADDPQIGSLMTRAGFRLVEGDVGVWAAGEPPVTIDLLVPASIGGAGRRGARLGVHGNRVAKKVPGLEGALTDRDLMTVRTGGPADARTFNVLVAGPSALLVSKLHKLADRQDQPRRLDNKDALDIFRILQGTSADDLAARYGRILEDPRAQAAGRRGVHLLSELFGAAGAPGSSMAADAVAGVDDGDFVATSCALLAQELRSLLEVD
jgi:hypothetical protein